MSIESTVEPPRGSPRAEGVAGALGRVLGLPLARLGLAALQFGLIILLIRAFELGNRALLRLVVLAWVGFLLHQVLPLRLRLPFFSCLSLAGIWLVLGGVNALWVGGIGLTLIGLAHLPVALRWRVVLLCVAGTALAAMRAGWLAGGPLPSPAALTILGSLFMFRMVVYLYDLRHRAAPTGFWWATSYFFLLPNVCFPLFPVVDYKTFCRTYRSAADESACHQTGILWMLRGCVHLLLYRLCYQNLLLDPAEVDSGLRAAQYVATTFLLYLQVSGSFHLAVGMLHLFGFGLPRTNQNYLLSSSFTDLWRRINVYWKDFILKLFFNPAYFALRRRLRSDTRAIVAAAVYAFVVTWLLHSYQWFWIRGSFPIAWQDVVFWSLFGAVVCVNMVLEMRRGRPRDLGGGPLTLRAGIGLGLRIVGTLAFLLVAWWIWTATSTDELRVVLEALAGITAGELVVVLGCCALFGVVAVLLRRSRLERRPSLRERSGDRAWLGRSTLSVVGVSCTLLLLAEAPTLLSFVPPLAGALDRATTSRLNDRDARRLERGYYEDLTDASRFDSELGSLYADQPIDWNDSGDAVVPTGRFPAYEMRPSAAVPYKGALQTTNRWGMRDREYALEKPPGTYRIAVLGSSHTKGSGVEDAETWENVVEDELSGDPPGGARYELLNFSAGGYGPLSKLAILSQKVLRFEPDAVLLEGIDSFTWVVNEVSNAAEKRIAIPFERVREITRAAGVTPGLPRVVAAQRLRPHAHDLVDWMLHEFAARCRERGIEPLAVFLPRPERIPGEAALIAAQESLARAAGFTVLSASGAYRDVPRLENLWIRPWDRHPNAEGHRMLAGSVLRGLRPWLEARVAAGGPVPR